MARQTTTTKEPIAPGVTQAQIDQLIQERIDAGASSCKVETEGNQRFLVCQWPPL